MKKSEKNSIKLGLFITIGLALFAFIIYYLGANKNFFVSTTQIHAEFKNVDGLKEGSVVRFAGIDVGTVQQISIVSDSTVLISMVIDNKARDFIKKNSVASIGSEGLIGSKLVKISSGSPGLSPIENGDQLPVSEPMTLDEAIAMVLETGKEAQNIIHNFSEISDMVRNGEGFLGSIITDTILKNETLNIVKQLKASSGNISQFSGDFADMASRIKNGEGTIGRLITEDDVANKVDDLLDSLKLASHHAVSGAKSLSEFTKKLNSTDGIVGKAVSDTVFTGDITDLMLNFNEAAKEISNTAEKINNSWILNLFGGNSNETPKEGENP